MFLFAWLIIYLFKCLKYKKKYVLYSQTVKALVKFLTFMVCSCKRNIKRVYTSADMCFILKGLIRSAQLKERVECCCYPSAQSTSCWVSHNRLWWMSVKILCIYRYHTQVYIIQTNLASFGNLSFSTNNNQLKFLYIFWIVFCGTWLMAHFAWLWLTMWVMARSG